MNNICLKITKYTNITIFINIYIINYYQFYLNNCNVIDNIDVYLYMSDLE